MKARLGEFLKSEDGQGMIEYGLIIGLVSVAAIAALMLLGPQIADYFTAADEALDPVAT